MGKSIVFLTHNATSRTTLAYAELPESGEKFDLTTDEYRVSKPVFPTAYQPTEASLYLTPVCNLSCSYCYIVPFYEDKPDNSLTTEQWKKIMVDLHSNGVRVLKFIGGEALIRRDLAELIRFAEATGFSGIELTTNGTYAIVHRNAEALEAFGQLKIHKIISTSIDSSDAAVNNKLRGQHSEVVRGIKYLQNLGLPLSVASVVTQLNYLELDRMAEFASEMGINAYQFNNMVPIFPEQRELVITDPEIKRQVVASIENIAERFAGRMSVVNRFVPAPNVKKELFERHSGIKEISESSLTGCPAGTREVYVLPNGQLIACPMFIRYPAMYSSKSIKDHSFEEVWRSDAAINEFRGYLTGPKLYGKCGTCASGASCKGGCRAMTFFMTQTLDAQDPRCVF